MPPRHKMKEARGGFETTRFIRGKDVPEGKQAGPGEWLPGGMELTRTAIRPHPDGPDRISGVNGQPEKPPRAFQASHPIPVFLNDGNLFRKEAKTWSAGTLAQQMKSDQVHYGISR